MQKLLKPVYDILKIALGCVLFGLGFNLFLVPNELNAGGLSGLAMIIVKLIGFGGVGTITAVLNLPLFVIAGIKLGKKFLVGSLLGMLFSSLFLDLFSAIPAPDTEPLIGALYGGIICGAGLGIVFGSGVSTGGSDIINRLLKLKYPNIPIGTITICFDLCVVVLTGIVFKNLSVSLYSGVAIFLSGYVVDAVVYRFDYSKVALIISKEHGAIAAAITKELGRGATFLHGEGTYSQTPTKVVLTAVKRQQMTELKRLVVDVDPNAFIIIQEAHQVLGDGFSRYCKNSL